MIKFLLFLILTILTINLAYSQDVELPLGCSGDSELIFGCQFDEELTFLSGESIVTGGGTEEEFLVEEPTREFRLNLLIIILPIFLFILIMIVFLVKRRGKKTKEVIP